jgi:hypothetical protein
MMRRFSFLWVAVLMAACGNSTSDKDGSSVVITTNSSPNNANSSQNSGSNNASNNQNNASNSGSNNASSNNSSVAMVAPQDYFAEQNAAICQALFDCPNASTRYWITTYGRAGDADACQSMIQPPIQAYDLAASVAAGLVEYDPAQGAECLEQTYEWLCDGRWGKTLEGIPACEAAFTGTRGEGMECRNWAECADGLYCSLGETCGERSCRSSESQVACGNVSCDWNDEFCDYSSGSPVCSPRVPVGQTCDFGQCEQNASCTHLEAGTCVDWFAQGDGESCVSDIACGVGLLCESSSCAAPAFGGPGATCKSSGALACEPGLICLITPGELEGVCSDPQPAGQPCSFWGDCAPDLTCPTSGDRVCVAYSEEGQPCSGGQECTTNECVDSMCVAACSR